MRLRLQPQRGYALATILILLGVCMFGAAALVTISILESRISRSQQEGTVAYYVAEAGVNDAMWRLNNTTTYQAALSAGTLNASYAVSNQPATGQSFTVTLTTPAEGAGYAFIDVIGSSNNGTFTAQRRVQVTVFQGMGGTPVTGDNAFLAGGSATVTNGSSALNILNGDFYARGAVVINQATVNGAGRFIETLSTYSSNSSSVTVAGIHASNYPPPPTSIAIPGYNFAQYNSLPTNRCTAGQYAAQVQLRCTPTQLRNLIGSNSSFTFNNAVVYVDSSLTMNSWARNKSITFNGLLVVNGDLSVTGAASNLALTFNNPGSNVSGLAVAGNINNSSATWVVNGVYYASGTATFTNSNAITVNGAVIVAGGVSINTGVSFTLNYVSSVITGVLGGTPTAVQVQHWEEEY
jgi:hypothetical protein